MDPLEEPLETILEDGTAEVPQVKTGVQSSELEAWSRRISTGAHNPPPSVAPSSVHAILADGNVEEDKLTDLEGRGGETRQEQVPPDSTAEAPAAAQKCRRPPLWGTVALIVFLLVIVGVGVYFLATRDDDKDKPGTRSEEINAIILSASGPIESGSPQEQAQNWILNEDTAQLSPVGEGSVSESRILQRYVLAVMGYSLQIPEDDDLVVFYSSLHECNWTGVTCINNFDEETVTEFQLTKLNLQGTIPTEVAKLYSLIKLDLEANAIVGIVPTELVALTSLNWLDLSENAMTGTLPTLPSSLYFVYLYNNSFTGGLPGTWFDSDTPSVKDYWVQRNELTGSIPTSISSLGKLRQLLLYDNKLSHPLPSEIASLAKLKYFDIAGNYVNGSIPFEFYTMTQLTGLYLNDNELTGKLLEDVSSLVFLKGLWVSGNSMTGPIPQGLTALPDLTSVTLHRNLFTGQVPVGLCDADATKKAVVEWKNLTADCGEGAEYFVECSCCTACYPLPATV